MTKTGVVCDKNLCLITQQLEARCQKLNQQSWSYLMSLKHFLLSSIAMSFTISGAYAADAVVGEPEATEYVRVCDAYGTGFFYIPGSETCLKMGGFVRDDISTKTGADGFDHQARGRLEFTSKNESEIGTVTGWIRFEQLQHSAKGQEVKNQYSLGVGGLEMGYRESQWERFSKKGGLTDHGANYGKQDRHYISYTYSEDAYSAIVSLDHDDSANYTPDVMIGVSGKFDKMSASLSAGYDETAKDASGKATLNTELNKIKLRIIGQYASGKNSYWYSTAAGKDAESSAFGVIAGFSAPLGDKLNLAFDAGYDKATGGKATVMTIGNLEYKIASGFTSLLEVKHEKTSGKKATNSGFIRFQRSF
jgi:hypothetical protein